MPKRLPPTVVLDAWALLALVFKEEPAAAAVRQLFEAPLAAASRHISWINLGEVYYMLARKKGAAIADEVLRDIQLLSIKVHEPGKSDILAAARLKAAHAISYADAFAVGLTRKLEGTLYTGDPEILDLKDQIPVVRLERH